MIGDWKTERNKSQQTPRVTGRLTAETNSHLKSWGLVGLIQTF